MLSKYIDYCYSTKLILVFIQYTPNILVMIVYHTILPSAYNIIINLTLIKLYLCTFINENKI